MHAWAALLWWSVLLLWVALDLRRQRQLKVEAAQAWRAAMQLTADAATQRAMAGVWKGTATAHQRHEEELRAKLAEAQARVVELERQRDQLSARTYLTRGA